jgi:putative FmdB family regulatory protein
MPTYQYRCTDCGNELEAVQKFTDPSLTDCPSCAGQLRKVFNAVGVVFKGSGFYRTDSRADAKSTNGSSATNGSGSSNGASSDGASTPTEKKSDSSAPSEKAGSKQPVTAGSGGASSGSSTAA